jgi:hypothetical protein
MGLRTISLEIKMPFPSLASISEIPEQVWIFLAKGIGAVCGSAISIAYLLPKNRREAFLRFFVGITIGMIFGTSAGIKLADYLNITGEISPVEVALSGAALASLCAWWALGILARLSNRMVETK